jgi:hypothetical protein
MKAGFAKTESRQRNQSANVVMIIGNQTTVVRDEKAGAGGR